MRVAPEHYPFSAVVGMDDLRLALLLCAVSPSVGGVLVRGEKGTAKSTTVRALAALLPPVDVVPGCRFACDPAAPDATCPDGPHDGNGAQRRPAHLVELPVGAAEERVLGSLHLERVLAEGVTAFEPGLLAAAHRGLLYVDEVNLLHDHLVDVLLDAAAMGRVNVERDQVSVTHASRFVLVGTMNPEEGELRPQLLDRFGLTVEVAASRDAATRVEVVRRGLDHERDPHAFAARFADEEALTAERIGQAQALLGSVDLPDAALLQIAEVCAAFDVDGMRADLVMARTALAHAAWHGRKAVTTEDVRVAARLALPHRRRRNPFDAPGMDDDQLDEVLPPEPEPEPEPERDPDPDPDGPDGGGSPDGGGPDGSGGADDSGSAEDGEAPAPDGEPHPAGVAPTGHATGTPEPARARLLSVPGVGTGAAGRRSRALTRHGRLLRTRRPRAGERGVVELPATLLAAAPHQRHRGRVGPGVLLTSDDVRVGVREGREGNHVLFCVDASGSMAARRRMDAVVSTVLSLLLDAYQRRDTVSLVVFRGDGAQVVLPPTSSVEVAARRLHRLPTGGRTPLAEGLEAARALVVTHAVRDPARRPLVVLVTDGRATHGPDAVVRSRQAAARLRGTGAACVVVDCEPSGPGAVRLELARGLAHVLGAEHLPLADVSAPALAGAVRRHVGGSGHAAGLDRLPHETRIA